MIPGDLSIPFRERIASPAIVLQIAAQLRAHPQIPPDQVMPVADIAVYAANAAFEAFEMTILRLSSPGAQQCAAGIGLGIMAQGSQMLVEALAELASARGAIVERGSLSLGQPAA